MDTRRDDAQVHVYNYQRLKQIMEGLKKHEDELKFFAMEMRAQRVVDRFEGKRGRAALNWLYEKTCNYGLSVARPSLWLAGSFLVTMLPMAVWLGWDRPAWYFLPKLKSAVGLSLANFLAPLNLRKDFVDADYLLALPAGLKLLGGVQTICGLLFAFLIGLSLRNRFRMK